MLSDIEIAQQTKMRPIQDVAADLGLSADDLEFYGKYKAKLSEELYSRFEGRPDGKLILVTAINPTPAGEGKTTTSVGLGQAMAKIGKKAIIALREPSLGPVFGIKGGAAGGGYAQVVPMEDINLHFTGDMHAITSANNLCCALLDNHMQQGNELGIDPRRILIKRCLDMNDRALRNVVVGLGGKMNGVPREDGFIITVASEVMAILCLASDLKKDAIKPNLVQTLEGTPAIMHGGPFANIAHGCNSIRATKLALKLADYCITEAGFGSDLGAEKFYDIKCRFAGFKPAACVLVATVRALKYNGGVPKTELSNENLDALKNGIVNLGAHIENMKKYGVNVVVAINRFLTDSQAELDYIADYCREKGAEFALSEVFAKGGEGGVELAKKVVEAVEKPSDFAPIYSTSLSIKEKINEIATKIYGASNVNYTSAAEKQIASFEKLAENMPVCIAKTQYSLSDDPTVLGRPVDFSITVKEVRLSHGAGFVVALTGDIMTMPGLPKVPAANKIDVDGNGSITGLF